MKDDDNPSDAATGMIPPPPPSRPGTLPPQAKIMQAASPTLLIALLVVGTFAGALLHIVSTDFLEKFFWGVLIAVVSGSLPSGVSDIIRRMAGNDGK